MKRDSAYHTKDLLNNRLSKIYHTLLMEFTPPRIESTQLDITLPKSIKKFDKAIQAIKTDDYPFFVTLIKKYTSHFKNTTRITWVENDNEWEEGFKVRRIYNHFPFVTQRIYEKNRMIVLSIMSDLCEKPKQILNHDKEEDLLETDEKLNLPLGTRILLIKYLSEADMLPLMRIHQNTSAQARILGLLLNHKSEKTLRDKLGKNITEFKTEKNLKTLLTYLEPHQADFPEIVRQIKRDLKLKY